MARKQSRIAGSRVCVTGGCGMIGSQLVELLVDMGAIVTVIDNNSRRNDDLPAYQVGGASYINADASNLNSCVYAFRGGSASPEAEAVDIVFNLAASVGGVIHNQANGTDMFLSNVGLQSVPVRAAEICGVPQFVQVSSVCVYSPEHNHPCKEGDGHKGDPHPANGGYAWAKRVGEKIALLSDIPHVVVVRPSNVFGLRDYYDDKSHVIPALIKKAYSGNPVKLYGNPDNVREFVFSTDVAEGMIAAAVGGRDREVYNLGCNGGNTITIENLAKKILEISGVDTEVIHSINGGGGGDELRWSDSSKALRDLDWFHNTHLYDGLKTVIKEYSDGLRWGS